MNRNVSTTPARDAVVEVHRSHVRVIGVAVTDEEMAMLRDIARRMRPVAPTLAQLIVQAHRDAEVVL